MSQYRAKCACTFKKFAYDAGEVVGYIEGIDNCPHFEQIGAASVQPVGAMQSSANNQQAIDNVVVEPTILKSITKEDLTIFAGKNRIPIPTEATTKIQILKALYLGLLEQDKELTTEILLQKLVEFKEIKNS